VTSTYLERLGARIRATGTVLCLGIDPDPDGLPTGFSRDLAGIERFVSFLLEAALPCAAAVKPNLGFFEAYGSAGVAVLERLRASVPVDVPFIADAKRGDITTTAARQAVALFDALGADAVTVNPYLGSDALAPFIERLDRFAYVLCRTSNPGAGELQDLLVEAAGGDDDSPRERLHERVARMAVGWGPGGTVGLVVGATAPHDLVRIRSIAPGLPFLVPGVGAQGGGIDPVLAHGPAAMAPGAAVPGGGLLVNVSRGIAGAGGDGEGDPVERVAAAAADWAARLPVLPLPPQSTT
jgi:orotidine 5'-phosphate decarboxylase subfamily 2